MTLGTPAPSAPKNETPKLPRPGKPNAKSPRDRGVEGPHLPGCSKAKPRSLGLAPVPGRTGESFGQHRHFCGTRSGDLRTDGPRAYPRGKMILPPPPPRHPLPHLPRQGCLQISGCLQGAQSPRRCKPNTKPGGDATCRERRHSMRGRRGQQQRHRVPLLLLAADCRAVPAGVCGQPHATTRGTGAYWKVTGMWYG